MKLKVGEEKERKQNPPRVALRRQSCLDLLLCEHRECQGGEWGQSLCLLNGTVDTQKIPWHRKWLPISSILASKIPRTEEPDGLQSMESQRVGHDIA